MFSDEEEELVDYGNTSTDEDQPRSRRNAVAPVVGNETDDKSKES